MGRVRANIQVDGRDFWTLFDTGARNTYVVSDVAADLPSWDMGEPQRPALGGTRHEVTRACALMAYVEGHYVETDAWIVDEIGSDETDKPIEVLFGALAMQRWGIRVVPEGERLDLTHYPEEFVEF